MPARSSVKGILSDASGRPVKDAVVMITAGTSEFNDMASVTNDSGEFYLSNVVLPGTYTLQIQGPGGPVTKEVRLQDSTALQLRY